MTSDAPPLVIERDGAVATLRFNRPKALNAIDEAMAEAMLDASRQLATDDSVRVVVLSGAGRAFMGGGDIGRFHAEPGEGAAVADAILIPLNEALTILADLPKPIIAGVHGAVAGAGISLAMAADLVVAADDSRFTMAYARIGASPDASATWSLPRLVGLRHALELALLADGFDAAEALRLGLVNRVVPAAALAEETGALARRLAQGPTLAYAQTRRLLRGAFDRSLPEQLEAERAAFKRCADSADFAEGIAAFFGKRPAAFRGC